jgi:predicted nucleotidyltransferase
MRLTAADRAVIKEEARTRAPSATVYLFGSRANDRARGGDIDLLIFPFKMDLEDRIRFKVALADRLGDQRIDLVVSDNPNDPFVRLARQSGVAL